MPSTEWQSLKRKGDETDSDNTQNAKRLKVDIPSSSSSDEIKFTDDDASAPGLSNLLRLSDDVLLMIMSYLSPADLGRLSRVCTRLATVTQDFTLWKNADFRSERMVFCSLWEYLKFMQPSTVKLALRGFAVEKDVTRQFCCYVDELMEKLTANCPVLETFIMEEFIFYEDELPFSSFPQTLKHLEMTSCLVRFPTLNLNYFRGIDLSMPQLQVLVLENCSWLTTHALMPISKCPNLRVLRLAGCVHVGNCVAYTSVSCRFGFKRLEELDVRSTQICNRDIVFFQQIATLTHLLVERPKHEAQLVPKNEDSSSTPEMFNCRTEMYGSSDRMPCKTKSCQPSSDKIHCVEDEHSAYHVCGHTEHENFSPLGAYHLVTDAGVRSLGLRFLPLGAAGMEMIYAAHNCKLQNFVVKDYEDVSDASLAHLAMLPSIRFVDVTGTSVTREGVLRFKNHRPDVEIVSSIEELDN